MQNADPHFLLQKHCGAQPIAATSHAQAPLQRYTELASRKTPPLRSSHGTGPIALRQEVFPIWSCLSCYPARFVERHPYSDAVRRRQPPS